MHLIEQNTCCLTGHRPKNLPWGYDESKQNCIAFKNDLYKIFNGAIKYGLNTFLVGMAEGFDMISAEILIDIRKNFKHIKIIAVIPCKNQEIKWSEKQQQRYISILKQCDNKIILSDTYTKDCMNNRNKFMINHSSVVIACFSGKPSGTKNTLNLAKENGLKIKIINSDNYISTDI